MSAQTADEIDRALSSSFPSDFEIVNGDDGRPTPPLQAESAGGDELSSPEVATPVPLKFVSRVTRTDAGGAALTPVVLDFVDESPPKRESLEDLVYFKDVARSVTVLIKLLIAWVLITFDCRSTLVPIITWLVVYAMAVVFALATVKRTIDVKYYETTEPISFPRSVLQPLFVAAADAVEPLLLTEEAAVDLVRSGYGALPVIQGAVLNVIYCTSFDRTAKALAIFWFARCFSLSTILFLIIIGLFTVPIGYRTYQADIDHIVDQLRSRMRHALVALPEPVRRHFNLDDDATKSKSE